MQSWNRTLTRIVRPCVAQSLSTTCGNSSSWAFLTILFSSPNWKSLFTCFQNLSSSAYLTCGWVFKHLFSVISLENTIKFQKVVIIWIRKHLETLSSRSGFQIFKFLEKKPNMGHVWFLPGFSAGSLYMVNGTVLEDKKQRDRDSLFMVAYLCLMETLLQVSHDHHTIDVVFRTTELLFASVQQRWGRNC